MYAIGTDWARTYSPGMELAPGETVVESVPADVQDRILAKQLRAMRHTLLRDSDWTQMADAPMTPTKKLEWAAYRTLLRDITALVGFPNVPLPSAPGNPDSTADGTPGQTAPITGG